MLKKVVSEKPRPLSDTPFVFVQTIADLEVMMSDLKDVTEVAVDLEHHSFRTFLGLTCLIQLSTRNKDFVIDALALRDDLECLNDIFTKPKVVKVRKYSN